MTFMPIFIASLIVFALFFIFLALGFIIQNKPIKGSCGGVASLMGDEKCQFCGDDPNKCNNKNSKQTTATQNAHADELGRAI